MRCGQHSVHGPVVNGSCSIPDLYTDIKIQKVINKLK